MGRWQYCVKSGPPVRVLVVIGVAGSGKSTVSRSLAERLAAEFLGGDDFHLEKHKAMMSAGIPLQDDDRWTWSDRLRNELQIRLNRSQQLVLACSVLKQSYRDRLTRGLEGVTYVYLHGSREEIRQRLKNRRGHFLSTDLLESEFSTLEEPPDAVRVLIANTPNGIVEEILLGLPSV
jgi:carbohydrate kinase (thermoresistant glucokinase family)